MTDFYNTVNPPTTPTEDETMKAFSQVIEFVSKARDAIVQASSLAKEVQDIRTELSSLKNEIEEAHRKNADFEQQLAFVRQERDAAIAERDHAKDDATLAEMALTELSQKHDRLQETHSNVLLERDQLDMNLTAERLEVKRLSDELERERAAHRSLRDQIEGIHAKLQPQPRDENSGQFQPKVASNW